MCRYRARQLVHGCQATAEFVPRPVRSRIFVLPVGKAVVRPAKLRGAPRPFGEECRPEFDHELRYNITSTAATSPAPVGAAYGASKDAVELLTRSWATEFAPRGVRVNAVSPGPVRTAGTTAMLGEHVDQLGRGNLRGRVGEPAEIAQVVGFLAAPESSYVNGSVFVADGGALSAMPA
jgi:NAD(P)-dependent dehydrogenase (short-subunit alcohol dehydrogenase family)